MPLRHCLTILAVASVSVALVFGPIGTDKPNPAGGSVSSNQPPNSFFAGSSPPYPTNDWWAGYAAGSGDAVCAGPFPYQSSLTATGVKFGISNSRSFDGTSIKQPTQTDWTAGFSEHSGAASDHKALDWDTQTVTLQYFTGGRTMTSYMVPGSPYMTFEYKSATPKFTSGQGLITSFAGKNLAEGATVTASGDRFLVKNSAGTYIIYSLSGSISITATAKGGGGTLIASQAFTGVIRVVKLSEAGHESLLDAHVDTYPTSVATSYSFAGDGSTLTFTWAVKGTPNDLLMLTWPHHRIKMQAANFPSTNSLNYLTTKGYMYPAIGNVWNMAYDLPTITWNAPRNPDASCKSSIIAGLEYEITHLPAVAAPGDFYYFGGHVGAVSRLALIAEHVGRSDLITPVVNYLRAMYEPWFSSSSSTLPAYETTWGGIINKAGANNANVDFGNGYYNDHHFHYGYFLAGAATIAKYDSSWKSQHKKYIDYFLRDIVNPSPEDPYFTVTRSRDWFAGHSWASGIANGAGSRDQESIGEAVNGYYGALLWADVTGNTDIKNYARMLVAQEQHAAKVYWHLYPDQSSTDRDQPYPEKNLRSLITIGNVEDWQSGAWLFWGSQKVQIAAIQILPVTPINEYMYDAKWAQNVYDYTLNELNDGSFSDDWKSVIYLAYSQANPSAAAQRSTSLTGWGSGNTYSNQMYFLSTRPGASNICVQAAANPQGKFKLRVAATGRFVSSSSGSPDLIASSATSQADATVYAFAFTPNAGTIQAVATGQFVTADAAGTYTISASRAAASTWETFVVRQKIGAATGTYSILAASNKKYVVVGSNGALVNSGNNEGSSTGFTFVS